MRYRLLGNSGLRVSEAALGTMTFGEDWGWGSAQDEARKVYDAFRKAGGNFIDTANMCRFWHKRKGGQTPERSDRWHGAAVDWISHRTRSVRKR